MASTPRFFFDSLLNIGDSLNLPDKIAHHIRVLRLKQGNFITLFNGKGGEYSAVLVTVEKQLAQATIKNFYPKEKELPYQIILAQSLLSQEKMDWLIEKTVELGVSRIVPIMTERSVIKLNDARADRRLIHWRAIIEAACEQCGRNQLPSIEMPITYQKWLDGLSKKNNLNEVKLENHLDHHASFKPSSKNLTDFSRIILSIRESSNFEDLPSEPPTSPITLLIGPEGGFTSTEEDKAVDLGFTPICLGQRILRAETAGIAILPALASRWKGW